MHLLPDAVDRVIVACCVLVQNYEMFKHFGKCGMHLVEASCAITAPLCRFDDCRSLGSQCYANGLSSFLKCSGMAKCNVIADIAKFQHNALNVKVRVRCGNYGEEG